MKKSHYGGSNRNNAGAGGHGFGAKAHRPKHPGGGNINKKSDMRPDGVATVSHKHPYPEGLS